jgi:hypothetical protein
MVIVSKTVFYLAINILNSIDNFVFTLLCIENGNASMYHIPSCIMLYHQHISYGTYVLCKEGWGKFQNDYMDKILSYFQVCE